VIDRPRYIRGYTYPYPTTSRALVEAVNVRVRGMSTLPLQWPQVKARCHRDGIACLKEQAGQVSKMISA
jgi:hypothetical protein